MSRNGGRFFRAAVVVLTASVVWGAGWPPQLPLAPLENTPYYNPVFRCRFPKGWALSVSKDSIYKYKMRQVVATGPDGKSELRVQFYLAGNALFPNVDAFLKANARGVRVSRENVFSKEAVQAFRYERPFVNGREALIVQPVGTRGSYFVFRYFADGRAYDAAELTKLVGTFHYKRASSRAPAKRRLRLKPAKRR